MRLRVTKEYVTIVDSVIILTGEYHADECEFVFDKIYDGLIKFAVFVNDDLSYKVPIEFNKCFIPWEVLTKIGNLSIGVYAYHVNDFDESLELRYSPSPERIEINNGSYTENATNTEPLTPTDKEVIFQELNNIDLKTKNISEGVEIEMTNPRGETTKSIVYNGKNGKNGKDGSDYVITEDDYEAIANVVESEITIPTKTSELQNDSNFVTNTDYATSSTAGVIKTSNGLGVLLTSIGALKARIVTYEEYSSADNAMFVGKGTLENVLANYKTYDNTERVIGSYFGKPLYRKIIQITKDEYKDLPTTSNSRKGLDVSSLNINFLVNAIISLNYIETNVKHNKVGYMHRTDTNNYELGCNDTAGGTLNFFIGNSILTGLDGSANILLEYTKTTD